MIVTLTGTPGTGKTSVAEEIDDRFSVIHLTRFARERGLGEEKEKEFEVDVEEMNKALEEKVSGMGDVIIEGHLSHRFPADYCIVLRCEPEELESRLGKRDYSREKVEENVEAEAIDALLMEAVEEQRKIIEVDTSGRNAGDVAEEILRRIEKGDTGYGDIDWTGYL